MVEPVKIELQMDGVTYKIENLSWDIGGEELLEKFKQLMVAAGFPPSILDNEDGCWEWVRK